MGKTGKCIVEHTEKGPLIQYIDKSPEAIAKKIEAEKRLNADKKSVLKETKAIEKYMDSLKNAENQQNNEENVKEENENDVEKIEDQPISSKIEIFVKSIQESNFFLNLRFYGFIEDNDNTEILKAKNPFEVVKNSNENIFLNRNLNFKTKVTIFFFIV